MNSSAVISIIIPCRNEEKFIGKCLDSILAQHYPKDKLEVLIVDGMSDDGTKKIVGGYAKCYPLIKLLNNPKKITPVAFNMGIRSAKGEIIMIMSSHATYDKEYISKCVEYLQEFKADNVGGTMITLPRNNSFAGKAVAIALSHRFGVGNSVFRIGTKKPTWVDTVFGGCYKKEVFEKIGHFNENLVSSSDMEFNLRLKKEGGRILLIPEIISYYYTRSDFRSFFKNNFRNGVWAILPFKYSKIMPISLRHLVPLAFILSLIGSITLSTLSSTFFLLFWLIFGSYLLLNIYFSIKIASKRKDSRCLFIMPIIFGSLHLTYGLGSLWGLLKVCVSKQFWKNRFCK
jgi:glycosyltransferase involved in cell wall biosynthesis